MGRTAKIIILIACALMLGTASLASEPPSQAVETALTFSSIIDEQNFAAAFWSGSELLRLANDEQEWIRQTERAQILLGPVLQRQLRVVRSVESYPGLPDDHYTMIYFEARTTRKEKAAEVFLIHQDGAGFSVCSYSIR